MSSASAPSIVEEEYRVWKKNSPYLYDLVMTHSLEWPSLTIQWLPYRVSVPDKDYSIQRLVLGTHTSDNEKNFLLFAEIKMPTDDAEIDARKFGDLDEKQRKKAGIGINNRGGVSAASSASSSSSSSSSKKRSTVSLEADDDDEGRACYGAGGGKIEIVQAIEHDGDVNRARYMPQNPDIIATKTAGPLVSIFDKTKHPSFPSIDAGGVGGGKGADLKLSGHQSEGFGLCWSTHDEGKLLSGSDDGLICIWDIKEGKKTNDTLSPVFQTHAHNAIINDVSFHPLHPHLFGAVSEDGDLSVFDYRSKDKKNAGVQKHRVGGGKEVNALAFNPSNEFSIATAGGEKNIGLWDLRSMKKQIHSLIYHEESVYSLQFAPFTNDILASSSSDRRIALWDLSRIGMKQSKEDEQAGPSELLFVHGGHCDRISDFSWNGNDAEEWLIASVSDDNVMQIWRPAENILDPDTEDMQEEGAEGEEEEEEIIDETRDKKRRKKGETKTDE